MKLSIITVNLNNREGLQKTIDSVVSQTFRDFEWIVIDGGSTDGSKELIEQYADHFAYWVSEPDKGVYQAMNKGVDMANGDYSSFMNSGDVYANESVLLNVFSASPCQDLLFGDWILQYVDKQICVKEPKTLSLERLFFWSICHQAMFVKTTLLKQKGYDESYRIIADWKRWLEAVIGGCSVHYIPELICVFDCAGMSFNNSKLLEDEKRRLFEEDFIQFKTIRDFYEKTYDFPVLVPLYDLYSSSRSNRRIIKMALKLIEVKNKIMCHKSKHSC